MVFILKHKYSDLLKYFSVKSKLLMILLHLFVSIEAFSQNDNSFAVIPDRQMYASGETLFAKIYTPANKTSIIVYLDLINQNGKIICGASFRVNDKQAAGYLYLPDSLSTGTYIIKAYQKNISTDNFALNQVYIVNRFDGLEKVDKILTIEKSGEIDLNPIENILFKNFSHKYKSNEQNSFSIELPDSILKEIDGNLMLNIALNNTDFNFRPFFVENTAKSYNYNENKGLIVSGTVFDKKDNSPAENINVLFSIPDSIPVLQYYLTKSDGRFYFLVEDYFGQLNSFIQCAANTQSKRLKIVIDQANSINEQSFKFEAESIGEPLKIAVNEMINTVTIQKIFEQQTITFNDIKPEIKKEYPFYGIPSQVVVPKLFYDLPNFNEISKELLPGVKFRNYNNEPTVFVINSTRRQFFTEKPLITIDGVPVSDVALIKDLKSTDIERIEICTSERYYGNLRFAGVLAIYTTKPDYTIFRESDQFVRHKIESIQKPFSLSMNNNQEEKIPDLRNLLYWNPSIIPQKNIPVIFNTSSIKGSFKLTVWAKNKSGKFMVAEKQFEVH